MCRTARPAARRRYVRPVPIFAARLVRLLHVRLTGWRLPLAIALFVFLTSWLAMALLEPAARELDPPVNL